MLKIVVFRCLLKNFKFYKCLKYVNYSSGSGNDENDNDKSSPKSKNNETDTTTTDMNSNDLLSLINNLLVNKNSSQKNKLSRRKTRNVYNEMEKKEKTKSDVKHLKQILSKSFEKNVESTMSNDDIKKEQTDLGLTKFKEILTKSVSNVKKKDGKSPNSTSLENFKNLLSFCKVEAVNKLVDRKQILSKSFEKNVESTMSKDDIKKEMIDSDFIKLKKEQTDLGLTKFKEILTKSVSNVKKKDGKEQTDLGLTKFKEILTKSVSNVKKKDGRDLENFNKNATSDLNDEKSPNSTSLENFKNLLSFCKVEAVNKLVDRKEFSESKISVSEYLKSILEIDLGFQDYKMEDDKKPFFVGKSDTNEDFIKLMNEIVIGDKFKVPVKYDSSEKSFISMSDPTMRLNIFTKIDSKIQTEKEKNTSIIDLIESFEYRKLNSNIPSSYFHECIQLTRDKIMRNFPIDNDQDSEELNVGFHEHVFPQQYLTGKLANTGVIGQYMNYVCMGLSQNPHLTIEQKKAHIKWYEEYLSNKQEEIELATKKSIDDLEYEKSLRNK